MGATDYSPTFARLVAAIMADAGAPPAAARRLFGSNGLAVGGKLFMIDHGERLVLKLPRARVDALVAAGAGVHFDPGHGRPMKEWVALRGHEAAWLGLAREARAHVAAQGGN